MGRIKTKLVKRKTKEFFKVKSSDLGTDFNANKVEISENMVFKSKKMRNIVAGYATRLKKAQEEI